MDEIFHQDSDALGTVDTVYLDRESHPKALILHLVQGEIGSRVQPHLVQMCFNFDTDLKRLDGCKYHLRCQNSQMAWRLSVAFLSRLDRLDSLRLGFTLLPDTFLSNKRVIDWIECQVASLSSQCSLFKPYILDVGIILEANSHSPQYELRLTDSSKSQRIISPDWFFSHEIDAEEMSQEDSCWQAISIVCGIIQKHAFAKIRLSLLDHVNDDSQLFSWGGNTHKSEAWDK